MYAKPRLLDLMLKRIQLKHYSCRTQFQHIVLTRAPPRDLNGLAEAVAGGAPSS